MTNKQARRLIGRQVILRTNEAATILRVEPRSGHSVIVQVGDGAPREIRPADITGVIKS